MAPDAEVPLVTVVIPARNEEGDIEGCLRSVLEQDHPASRLEIIVVDGASHDRTRAVAQSVLDGTPIARSLVIENSEGSTPSNLNAGLHEAKGDILCRLDARSRLPDRSYVSTCVEVLTNQPDVWVVGGSQRAVPSRVDAVGVGMARGLNNRFGMGLSRYRRGAASGPADTVYLGAFRTDQLRGLGGWDVRFATNQDFELNQRCAERGTVWYDDRLVVDYLPRRDLAELFTQYRRFGRWKVRYWRLTGGRPQGRQLFLLSVPVLGVLASLILWRSASARMRLVALPALAGTALGFEELGSTGPPAGVVARAVSLLTTVIVGVAWSAGVWHELLVPSEPR